MRRASIAALAFTALVAGFTTNANAQLRTTPPGKLFFEGDIVKHNIMGQQGPFCVLQSQFKRGEAIAWRMRTVLPNGTIADNTTLRSLVVELGNGQRIPLNYGPHGMPPTDYFWSESWQIPADFPTGSLGYKIHATMMDGSVVTWEPFTRAASQLTIIAGTPTMAAPAP